MIKVKSFKKLKGNSKKYEITFEKNGKTYTRKFGAAGMSDYTVHKDKDRRERYISRHKKDLRTNDPMRAGYLSMYILWNKPSLKSSLADYKRRLNVYNKTGKFPKGITGSKKLSFGSFLDDVSETKKLDKFFQDKLGTDLTRVYIRPDLKANLRPQAIKVLQKRGRKYLYNRENLLEQLTKKFNIEINKSRPQPYLIKGREWSVLEPILVFTPRWFRKAAETITFNDIVNKESKWNKILYGVLLRMRMYEKDGDPVEFFENEGFDTKAINYKGTRDYIVNILRIGGHNADPEKDDEWVDKALTYLKSSNSKFGKKTKCKNAKKKLKQMLWKLHAKYENNDEATAIMRSGRPWTVLNPVKKETSDWLYLAADCLTLKDYQNDSLWPNSIEYVVDQFVDIDPDYNTVHPRSRKWLETAEQNLEMILRKMSLSYEISEPGWYNDSLSEIKDVYGTVTTYQFGKKYKIPDNVVNKKLYSVVKAKIKRSIKGRRWGAYDSGRLVREYKAAGGKYKGSKGKTNLSRWYKEKWVDACAWPKRKPCGRKTKESIAYCRPSKKVDSKTPKLVQKLTAAQRKSRCARKKKSPMKRITKFGVEIPTPDIDIGDGWVIHCTHVPGVGNHATLRRKSDDWYPSPARDHAFRYGIKNRGGAPEFWARGPLAQRNGGLPNPRFQQILMDHYYNYCGGYNPRQLPPPSPAPGSSVYLNSFGNKKKLK
jgi:hypothetical protein